MKLPRRMNKTYNIRPNFQFPLLFLVEKESLTSSHRIPPTIQERKHSWIPARGNRFGQGLQGGQNTLYFPVRVLHGHVAWHWIQNPKLLMHFSINSIHPYSFISCLLTLTPLSSQPMPSSSLILFQFNWRNKNRIQTLYLRVHPDFYGFTPNLTSSQFSSPESFFLNLRTLALVSDYASAGRTNKSEI